MNTLLHKLKLMTNKQYRDHHKSRQKFAQIMFTNKSIMSGLK